MEAEPRGPLVTDVLVTILETFRDDYDNLYQCSLVNGEFNQIASKVLYSQVEVTLSQLFPSGIVTLAQNSRLERGQFISSCLSRNAIHVRKLKITSRLDFLSAITTSGSPGKELLTAIQSYHNIRAIELSATTTHPEIFADGLIALAARPTLRELTMNSACIDESAIPSLITVGNLEKLSLRCPSRAILNVLPYWLSRLSSSLRELHLKDDCGSITPGVLRSFIPYIQSRIRSFSLGLSYSLTDEDVISFLNELPELTSVQLQYYLQLKIPAASPCLPNLRSFAVTYTQTQIYTRPEVDHFCAWVRRAISSSHSLQVLHLVCEKRNLSLRSLSFDALISHVIAKHFATISILDLGSEFIGGTALKQLCTTCVQLEELVVGIGRDTLLAFITQGYSSSMRKLRSAAFSIHNVKRTKLLMDMQTATKFMTQGPPMLRRFAINNTLWEGSWVSESSSRVVFVVEEI